MPPKKAETTGTGKSKSSEPTVDAESSSEASALSEEEETVQAKKAKLVPTTSSPTKAKPVAVQQDQHVSSESSDSSSDTDILDTDPDQPTQPLMPDNLKNFVSFYNDKVREETAVNFFKEHEYLYNKKCNDYRDTKKKDADRATLAEMIGIPPREVELWWRGLRDRY